MRVDFVMSCENHIELLMCVTSLININKNDPIVLAQVMDLCNMRNLELLVEEHGNEGAMNLMMDVVNRMKRFK